MKRDMPMLTLELPRSMKNEIDKAVQNLHFHNRSELARAGIRKLLDELTLKDQLKTNNI